MCAGTFRSGRSARDVSTRRRSAMLDIPRTTLQRILRKELDLYPYWITKRHALPPGDIPARLQLANWYLRRDAADDDFVQNIGFTDEASGSSEQSQRCSLGIRETKSGSTDPSSFSQVYRLVVWCAVLHSWSYRSLLLQGSERSHDNSQLHSFALPGNVTEVLHS